MCVIIRRDVRVRAREHRARGRCSIEPPAVRVGARHVRDDAAVRTAIIQPKHRQVRYVGVGTGLGGQGHQQTERVIGNDPLRQGVIVARE